jgi:hypothetical protein
MTQMAPMTTPSDRKANSDAETSVRLSPSQKAYRQDPEGFVNRLSERAATLFESGYVVYPTIEPHVFVVANHEGKEEKAYTAHALDETCTCPFYTRQIAGEYLPPEGAGIIPCKHLGGLATLVLKTRRWLHKESRLDEYCALWTHWMKTLAAIRKRRIQRETSVEKERQRKEQAAWQH